MRPFPRVTIPCFTLSLSFGTKPKPLSVRTAWHDSSHLFTRLTPPPPLLHLTRSANVCPRIGVVLCGARLRCYHLDRRQHTPTRRRGPSLAHRLPAHTPVCMFACSLAYFFAHRRGAAYMYSWNERRRRRKEDARITGNRKPHDIGSRESGFGAGGQRTNSDGAANRIVGSEFEEKPRRAAKLRTAPHDACVHNANMREIRADGAEGAEIRARRQ